MSGCAGRPGVNVERVALRRYVLLPLALVVVFLVVYHPHHNWKTGETRTLPVHMDEYVHWGLAEQMLVEDRVAAGDPFSGQGARAFDLGNHLHERGFQAYIAVLHEATGIPWPVIFQFGPALVAVLAALLAFALAERWGAGVEAALFVAIVPTSLRFLGPGFLVPIAFAVPFVIAGMLLALEDRGRRGIVALGVVSAALWTFHAMAAGVLVAFCSLVALTELRRPSRAAGLLAVSLAPAVVASPYYASRFAIASDGVALGANLDTLALVGAPLFVLAAIGCAALAMRRDTGAPALALGGLILLGMAVVVHRARTGADPYGLYDRTWTLLPWMVALSAGSGIALAGGALERLARMRLSTATARRVGAALAILLFVGQLATVASAAGRQLDQQYYEIVTPEKMEEYRSVRSQLPADAFAHVDGHTLPFTLATGTPTLHVWTPSGGAARGELAAFFDEGATDTLFLLEHRVNVVVTDRPVDNPYLRAVSPSVYVLDERLAEALRASRDEAT